MEAALVSFLRSHPGVSKIVDNRVASIVAAEGLAYPLVVFFRTRTDRTMTKSGPTGGVKAYVEFRCLAERQGDVERLSQEVRKALHGHRGAIGDLADTYAICTDDKSGYDAEMKVYVGILEFMVWYSEDI